MIISHHYFLSDRRFWPRINEFTVDGARSGPVHAIMSPARWAFRDRQLQTLDDPAELSGMAGLVSRHVL
jgi:hypothetical protein